ncbi:MAG: hypothetical protein M0Q02_07600 [Candidatus Muirbacterium halophilum]|nr:hypothetical protein [Candidatus Muirbacterium halophilum]
MVKIVMKISTIVLISVFFIGCAGTFAGTVVHPTATQIAEADYGKVISQEEAENIIKIWYGGDLKDPESAKYKFDKIEKSYLTRKVAFKDTTVTYGYIIDFECNAKNSYGGYVGWKAHSYFLRNGNVQKIY